MIPPEIPTPPAEPAPSIETPPIGEPVPAVGPSLRALASAGFDALHVRPTSFHEPEEAWHAWTVEHPSFASPAAVLEAWGPTPDDAVAALIASARAHAQAFGRAPGEPPAVDMERLASTGFAVIEGAPLLEGEGEG